MQSKFIKTLEEVLEYLPVQMTTEIEVVDPFFSNTEKSYLINLLGKEQFKALVLTYESAEGIVKDVLDEELKEAIALCQKVVTCIGYYKAIPILSVKIGASGIQVFSNDDTKQAFNWQVDDVKKSLLELGYGAIEDLLLLLEENPDKFPEYINSEQFISSEQFLIESAADFDIYFRINRSRYIFNSLSYIMLRIENQIVKKVLGTAFFDTLKFDDLEGKLKILTTDFIKPAIALLTAEKALVERVITFENGVASINLIGNYNNSKSNIAATRDEIAAASEQLLKDGNQFLQDGLQYIYDNLSDFEGFTPPTSKKLYNIKNNPEGGVFAI